jgi:hypothetical protein
MQVVFISPMLAVPNVPFPFVSLFPSIREVVSPSLGLELGFIHASSSFLQLLSRPFPFLFSLFFPFLASLSLTSPFPASITFLVLTSSSISPIPPSIAAPSIVALLWLSLL